MMISENTPTHTYSGLRAGGEARYFAKINDISDIAELKALARTEELPLSVIGEGTNSYFGSGTIQRIIAKNELTGIDVKESEQGVTVKAMAGENWDELVDLTVGNGWSGIEALSAIPGSVGATPVQNVGAYGSEVSEVIERVEVYDLAADTHRELGARECEFSYRDSIFKRLDGRFIVTAVIFNLSKQPPQLPEYRAVSEYFKNNKELDGDNPTLAQIRDAITEIRWSKLPKPDKTPNVGSFFKNPVVSQKQFQAIKADYPEVPAYQLDSGVKIPAGWLIDTLGFKGKQFGTVAVYKKNALILTGSERTKLSDIQTAQDTIVSAVKDAFSIELEREPRFID